jgi:anaerobic magnesium-protoporphyrin IX monomethyl ester cyclase
MRFTLIGADLEENLGMGMIAAAATGAGHRVVVLGFNDAGQAQDMVKHVLATCPDVVGLAAQFQHRGAEFLALAAALRRSGFRGHITAGGHFATMGYANVLGGRYGVDSVVLYDGEETVVELLAALADGRNLAEVPGIAWCNADGTVMRTTSRCLPADLDALPIAQRYRPHARHMGIPFVPVSGGRGCWASCSFCSITSILRDARAHGAHGRLLRQRTAENVAAEMAVLAQAVGGNAIFCFHDENFLLPRPADSLERVAAMKRCLDASGVERAAFVGKCRPDTLTPDLARRLAELGVIRLYVGVENASACGAEHLNRRVSVQAVGQALDACSEAGITSCYNLLLFEPDTTLDDVATNVAFIRAHAEHPINFCRAEPYLGTPLYHRLKEDGNLAGSFLGWDYRLSDDRAELLFRICAAAFRERNFASEGVANRYMGLNYSAGVLDWFYRVGDIRKERLRDRAHELTKDISLDTAELLEQALDLASRLDPQDHDLVARQTAMLGLEVAARDCVWHAALDALMADLRAFAATGRRREEGRRRMVGQVARVAQGAAFAGWLALWAPGCDDSGNPVPADGGRGDANPDFIADARRDATIHIDPAMVDARIPDVRPDYMIADMLPPDAGTGDVAPDRMVLDPVPPDARRDTPIVLDPVPPDARISDARIPDARPDYMVLDPLPPDARPDYLIADPLPPDARRDTTGDRIMILDPLPPDAGRPEVPTVVDMAPAPTSALSPARNEFQRTDEGAYWANTTPRRAARSRDLALCLPPEIRLQGEWVDGTVAVRLVARDEALSIRWQSDGTVSGEDRQVIWTPASDQDQLSVAVRSPDGVAVAELRLCQVCGRRG